MSGPVGLRPLSPARALEIALPVLARRPLLVSSDFDGTLAELSSDPWGARMVPGARRALRRLAGRPDVEVVLLSARGAADLATRVRVGGATYLGDHGTDEAWLARRARRLERRPRHPSPAPDDLALAEALAQGVPHRVPASWLVVERKPPSVCFHFRTAPDPEAARAAVAGAADAIDPRGRLLRTHGRRALELRPPDALTKGPALARLLDERRPSGVILLGDDPNDAAAFEALRHAMADGRVAGLAVAVASHPEWLPALAPHADLLLAGPHAAGRFLAAVARALGRATPAPTRR